jgi:glycosyltransferase involved in cell wall biosynthesis
MSLPERALSLDSSMESLELVPSPTVSVVIPTLNEAKNIGWVLSRMPESVDEVIIVDGRSTDGTIDVALAIDPSIVIVEEKTPGKGAALRAGFQAATSDYIVMIDADGSMDPREISRFVDSLHEGADLVKGSRFMPEGDSTDITWLRRFGNGALTTFTNVIFGSKFTDLCYGFCAFRRSRLADLALDADGFEIESQIIVRAIKGRLSIAEVPSSETERLNGESNLRTFRDGQRVLRTIVRERLTRRPALQPEEAEVVDLTTLATQRSRSIAS